jgi:hypothetical protein
MATRMQQRRGTASQWTSANPILNAGEMGWESDTNKFKIGDGTNHWADLDYFIDQSSTVNPSFGTSIVFEGATADSYETTLQVTDPTDDRTITLPNVSGTVITTGNLSDITNIGVFTSTITMEGSSADDYELTLSAGNPTADRTITFPDATGTVALTSNIPSNTDSLSEGSTNKYFTDERAQDAIGNSVSTGLLYNDTTGAIYVDSSTVQLRIADVSDTEISYLNGVTSAIQTQLDGKLALSGGTMTGAIAMGTNKITGLGTPTADADAATKAYVDAATAGLNVHAAVQAATTANITLASALENGDTLDGVTLATGNRVLVKNQTDKTENGIYVVKASGAPDRADDYNTAGEVDAGDFIFVEAGTANGKTGYVQTNVITTVGSDNIEFTQFSGAGTYTAGNGLTLTGSSFSIDTTITQTRVADVSDTEISYLNGVTSAIQTQLDSKLASATASSTYAPLASPTFTGTVTIPNGAGLGTPTTLTLTNATGLPVSGITSSTSTALGLGSIELGHASDTTIARGSAGVVTIEGVNVVTTSSTDTLTNKTLSSALATTALTLNATAELRFADTDSSHYVGFKSPGTVTTNKVWTLPSADGTAGQALSTDGSGNLSWATSGGGAAFSELMLIGA